jgi:SAM-dependent methyltransferase
LPLPLPIQRALDLFEPNRRPVEVDAAHGYIDLLGATGTADITAAQRLMRSRALPRIYERFWRPLGVRLIMGVGGPGTDEEHEMALTMLSISSGDRVLDVACGPGNFTRDFGLAASEGLVVGLDASETMLEVAVRDTRSDNIAYVRGDACELPFRDGCFDAVCCFAALYLIDDPGRALEEIVRVLAPGGRLALMSTCIRNPLPTPLTNTMVQGLSGVRMFGRDELTPALAEQGVAEIEQRVAGLAQFVSGRKPPASGPAVP